MNKLLASTALGFLLIPGVAANAQQPSAADMQRMQALPGQIEALHKRAHIEMMAAITPEHRALVAKLKASHVSPGVGAKRIDAALSPREARAVLAIDRKRRDQEHRLVQTQGPPGLMLQETGKPDAGDLLLNEEHMTLMTPQ